MKPILSALTLPIARRQRAFTLIELLVVVGIVSILASVAIPAMRDYIERSRVSDAVESLRTSLEIAASEAFVEGRWVAVCRASGDQCVAAGTEPEVDWAGGWIAWHDSNRNGLLDAGEPILRRQGPVDTGSSQRVFVVSEGEAAALTFIETGFLRGGGAARFTVGVGESATELRRPHCVVARSRGLVRIEAGTCPAT